MANLFGIPQYDPTLDRENMQINAGLVQNLGAQVRNDLTAIQTNRQLKGLAEGLQGLNTNTEDFGQRAVGLMMQYPLAAKSPIGTAAIQQLGAQHKLWQQERLREANPYLPVAGGYGAFDRRTGKVTGVDPGVLPAKPLQRFEDAYGNPIMVTDPNNMNQPVALPEFPIKTDADASNLQKQRHADRMEEIGARKPASLSSPEFGFLKQNHAKAFSNAQKLRSEAERLQGIMATLDISSPQYEPTRAQAAGMIRAADQAEAEFKDLDNRVNAIANGIVAEADPLAAPSIPAAPVNQLGAGAAAVDNSIMAPLLNEVRQLDQKTARELLKEANGDRDKARALAKERGYSF